MINSTAYYNDFWNEMRGTQEVLGPFLQAGTVP